MLQQGPASSKLSRRHCFSTVKHLIMPIYLYLSISLWSLVALDLFRQETVENRQQLSDNLRIVQAGEQAGARPGGPNLLHMSWCFAAAAGRGLHMCVDASVYTMVMQDGGNSGICIWQACQGHTHKQTALCRKSLD